MWSNSRSLRSCLQLCGDYATEGPTFERGQYVVLMANTQSALDQLTGICGEDIVGPGCNSHESGVMTFNDEKRERPRIRDVVVDHVKIQTSGGMAQ